MKYRNIRWFEAMGSGRYLVRVWYEDGYGHRFRPIDFRTDDYEEALELRDDIREYRATVVEDAACLSENWNEDEVLCKLIFMDGRRLLSRDCLGRRRPIEVSFDNMLKSTEEWMDGHGYFAGGPCYDVDKPAKHCYFEYDYDEYAMIVGHGDGEWFAEIEDADGAAVETWTNVQPDLAIAEALCMLIARTAYAEEGNCEDAVNRTAYETFSLMHRGYANAATQGEGPDFGDAYECFMLDTCMGYARRAVKYYAKDMWREF